VAKIHHLEQRLNDRKEALLEKELILEEVTRLSEKLRKQVGLPWGEQGSFGGGAHPRGGHPAQQKAVHTREEESGGEGRGGQEEEGGVGRVVARERGAWALILSEQAPVPG